MSKLGPPLPRALWPDFSLYRPHPATARLCDEMRDAHARTCELIASLDDAKAVVPQLPILNLPIWEIGHVAWFQEFWLHRRGNFNAPSILPNADALYDSSNVPHATRWSLPLPDMDGTRRYLDEILKRSVIQLERASLDDETAYFAQLALYHQDMHNEAFSYTWHTLGWPLPGAQQDFPAVTCADIAFAGGQMMQGAAPGGGFAFDNEKWANLVDLAPFRIANRAVNNAEFREFVDAGGYQRREFWSDEAWAAREQMGLNHPRYWKREGNTWLIREFEAWKTLPESTAARHISGIEADAYCRWAKRRLPTEAEWEFAAKKDAATNNRAKTHASQTGNTSFQYGAVWEWTASRFLPYPGFSPDPYQDYSAPWFEDEHRVLRGGSFVTPRRFLRPTFRNFYTPTRADMFCGFRTCALD